MTNERLAALREAAMQDDLILADSIELIQEVDRLLAALDALTAEYEASARDAERMGLAEALIEVLTDPDPCEYDHHDYCQAHSLAMRPCPHEQAKAFFAARAATPSEGTPR